MFWGRTWDIQDVGDGKQEENEKRQKSSQGEDHGTV
jgi:hypothetical protein